MEFQYVFNDETQTVKVERVGAQWAVTVMGETHLLTPTLGPTGEVTFTLNGVRWVAQATPDGERRWVALNGQTFVLTVPAKGKKQRRGKTGGHETLAAQMPGVVRRVLVADGDAVEKGQTLLALEAMKMEIKINAPHAGAVEKVLVSEGQTVERGQVLINLLAKA